jgi:hypothetical protein
MKGYIVFGEPYEIKRFRVKSISNPDERDKCLSKLILLKKTRKRTVRHKKPTSKLMLFRWLNQDVIFL